MASRRTRGVRLALLSAVVIAAAQLVSPAPTMAAEDAEPVGDASLHLEVDPETGMHLYLPADLDLQVARPVPVPDAARQVPNAVDLYAEDVQAQACFWCPLGTLGQSTDSDDTGNTWAPFTYTFKFKTRVYSRDFYTHRSTLCIDNISTAKPRDARRPVTYSAALFDDHGNYGSYVAGVRFTSNVGWTGLCFQGIDTTNRYFVVFGWPDNHDGYITGEGNIDNS